MHLRLHKLFDPVVRIRLTDVELFGANDDAEEEFMKWSMKAHELSSLLQWPK